MNKLKAKSTVLFAMVLISAFILPNLMVVKAQSTLQSGLGFEFSISDLDDPNALKAMPGGMAQALGNVFRMMSVLGPSGAALGEVFALLFENIQNVETIDTSAFKGLYMINASYTDKKITWQETYQNRKETHWLYKQLYQDLVGDQSVFVEVVRSGTVTMTYESGANVVFILWDWDESLITAINKVITAYRNVKQLLSDLNDNPNQWTDEQKMEVAQAIIGEVLQAVVYLLFHINDIIDGDELIVSSIISWEKYNFTTSSGFSTTVTAKKTQNSGPAVTLDSGERSNVIARANLVGDKYAQYLLTQADLEDGAREKVFTTMSFNLVELWLKNFEIHINASIIADALVYVLSNGEQGTPFDMQTTPAKIFQGLDIEMYLITHSLFGFVAYDDDNADGVPTANYEDVTEDGTTYQVITDSEVKYWFALGNTVNPTFHDPVIIDTPNGKALSWSISMDNVELIPIPVGLSAADVFPLPPAETISKLEMGFTFCPVRSLEVETDEYDLVSNAATEVKMGAGIIKLDQTFGEWNGGAGLINNGGSGEADLTGLDFAVLFISTMLHFHLNIMVEDVDLTEEGTSATAGLVNYTDYKAEGAIYVGNNAGDLPLAAIDIAGPNYELYEDGPSSTPATYPAKTTTIPLAYAKLNLGANVQYIDDQNPNASFKASGFLNIEASVVIYAVSYPEFNGDGYQIIHDPTFSIFMTWENPGFWAVILVIGTVTLVAVAAIMITKKKNRA